MEQQRKDLFTPRSLTLLILPIVAETILTQLVSMVDGIMVSSVGEVAISAVSLVTNVSAVIIMFLTALATGGSIVTSQLIGARQHKEAQRSTGQVITMVVITGSFLGLICLLFSRNMLMFFFGKVEPAVLDNALTYFFYDALSYPFMSLCGACGAILRSRGESKNMLYVGLLRNAINIVGNAICIYGLKMGVAGVAIPTAASRIIGAAILMSLVMRKSSQLRPSIHDIFHINRHLMWRMLRVGIPTAIESTLFQFGKLLTLSMVSGFSTAQIAANSTSGAILGLVATVNTGIRTGAMNVIGQCVGARDERQIKLNAKRLHIMSYLFFGCLSILVLLFRHQIVGLYVGLSPEAASLTAELLCIYLIAGIFLYVPSFCTTSMLRASNNNTYLMCVSIFSMLVFRLSFAWLLCVQLGWGAKGVVCAAVVDWFCRAICFSWQWYSGAWKKNVFTTPQVPGTK